MTESGTEKTVVVVDDDESVLESLSQAVSLLGYDCAPFGSAVEALRSNAIDHASCVLSDMRMPSMDGLAFYREVASMEKAPPFILLTAFGDVSTAVSAIRDGVYDFIEKPADNETLAAAIARAVERHSLARRARRLEQQLADALASTEVRHYGIVGQSAVIRQLLKTIEQYAQSPRPALVFGETGSGKELVSAALHKASPRAKGPYVPVNVGAIPESLVASELFGHEKGAFTGAQARRAGLFEAASGGTLMLDEIESAPAWLQVQLLRAVDNQRITRVGGTREIPVDVRVVATSNQPLEELTAKGEFREDLYYRLSGLPITVPPLRDRREDIPELSAHIIRRVCEELNRPPVRLKGDILAEMRAYDWPGNVRQLENVIGNLCVTCEGDMIENWRVSWDALPEAEQPTLKQRVEAFEKSLITDALKQANGKILRACEILSMPRKTLYDRMIKYDLDRGDFRDQ